MDPVNKLVPRWSRMGKVVRIFNRSAAVQDLWSDKVSEHHLVHLRPLEKGALDEKLNDYEMIFYGALAHFGVSTFLDLRVVGGELQVQVEYDKGETRWETAKEWYSRMPLYFNALYHTDACQDAKVKEKMQELGAHLLGDMDQASALIFSGKPVKRTRARAPRVVHVSGSVSSKTQGKKKGSKRD